MIDALHLLMAAYGWTLPQVLALTLPQVRMLFRAIQRHPPVNVFLPALVRQVLGAGAGEKGAEKMAALGVPRVDEKDAAALLALIQGQEAALGG